MDQTIDLDDLFNDIYCMDLPGGAPLPEAQAGGASAAAPAQEPVASKKRPAETMQGEEEEEEKDEEQLKIERRERNREHAKRSRLRKKFLLESLQEQIHGLEEQMEGLKNAIKKELPDKAEQIISSVCGDKEKYKPFPVPSGFGPVKTLMEPDFRLSTYQLRGIACIWHLSNLSWHLFL
jgi:hypothetical protein